MLPSQGATLLGLQGGARVCPSETQAGSDADKPGFELAHQLYTEIWSILNRP
jgi:hypothetical protein